MQSHNISSYPDLFDYYFSIVNTYVQANRTRIYWNADALQNLTYFKDAIIHYWAGLVDGEDSALVEIDNPVILSNGDIYLLGCGTGDMFGENSCTEFHTWWQIY